MHTDFGLDQLAKSGTRLKSVLLYHVLPGGAYSAAQLAAATSADTVLGQDLSAAYPVQLSMNATNGVSPHRLCLAVCRTQASSVGIPELADEQPYPREQSAKKGSFLTSCLYSGKYHHMNLVMGGLARLQSRLALLASKQAS